MFFWRYIYIYMMDGWMNKLIFQTSLSLQTLIFWFKITFMNVFEFIFMLNSTFTLKYVTESCLQPQIKFSTWSKLDCMACSRCQMLHYFKCKIALRKFDLSGRRGTGPPTESGFSQGFFSILSPMEFWFLAAVASGLLSWGNLHFQIAQILFKLN